MQRELTLELCFREQSNHARLSSASSLAGIRPGSLGRIDKDVAYLLEGNNRTWAAGCRIPMHRPLANGGRLFRTPPLGTIPISVHR